MEPQHIINLSFHGIGRPLGRDYGEGERDLWVKLHTLEAALDACAGRDDVRLSFDDGNSTDIDIVLPALTGRGLTATFFIVPGWLGTPGFLSKRDLRELVDSGMTIGNHGLQHHNWTLLSREKLEYEVGQARRLLEDLTGRSPDTLAIPYGAYDDGVLDTLRRQGYEHVYTSDGGAADPQAWLQPREHARASHDPAAITALLGRPL